MMDSVSSPLEPKCDSLSVVADVSLALGTNAARNPPPIDLGIVSDRSVVSTAATMENGEDVSSPAVSALMADFDIDSILSPSEDSTRSSLATGATDRTNEETCRGGDFMRSRVYQQNVADDKNVPIGLDSKLGSQIVAEKAVNNNNISAPCSNERNLARVEPHVYRSKSACDKNKTASSNLMTSCIQVQQILQDSATSTSPMANGTNYGLPYLGDRTLKEDLTGMDVQRNAEELEIIVRELRQGLSRVFEQLNSAVDDDSKLKKQLSTHRGELAEVCRLAVGLRNDVSKLSDRQQRLENEFKMLRDEQQIMKLSLMELSQSNRERNKNSFDGEKTFERSSASEEQKKRTPMVENVMKRGDKDIGVSQKFERTFSSCANFLPIDGVDSDVFSTAKENNNSVSKYCDVSSHGLSGFHSGVEESKGEPKTIPTTSSPLCVQSRVENLPANHEPQLNPGISQPNADSKSSVSDLQMESLNSMLKEVLSEETCAIEQVQHLVNYYLKPCRKFDSSASHATVPSGSNTAGGGSKNSVATNGSCQSIQSKNIFPSILRSIKEGMLQIWDALRKCQELLLLQAKSSSGSSAKTGGNGNSGLNGNYMLPVVSEAISKFINEMEAVLTQLASHNDKDLLLNVSLYFTGLPKNFDEFDKTLSNSSLFYNFVQDTVQVTRSKFGARCEHVKQSGDLVKWLHLSPYRFLHSFLRFLQTVSQILTKCSCGERSSAGGSNSHKSCMPSLENNVAMSAGEEQENCLSMIQVAFDLQKDPSMPSTMSNICIESAIKFKRLLTAIHKVDKKASPVLSQLENALKNSVHETILVYSKLSVDQLQLKKSSQETLSRPSNSSGSVNNNNNGTLDSTSSRDRRSGTPVASVTPTSTQKVLEYLGDYPPVIPRTPTSFSQNSMSMSDLSILSSSHYYPSHPVAHPPYRHSAITVDTSGGSAAALYYPHSEPPNPHKLPHPTGTHENANGRKQNSHPAHETSVHLLRMSPKKGAGSRKSSQLSDSYSRDVFSHQLFAGGGASFDLNDASVHGVPQGLVQARSKEFERIAKLASSAEDCSNQYDTQRERRNSTTMASATDRNNYVITRNPSQASSANQNHYHDLNVSLNHSSGRNNHVNMMAAYARPRHIL